jgi:hypothetical protein
MVEQIRSRDVKNRPVIFNTMVSYRRRQMSLTATTRSGKHQPSLRLNDEFFSYPVDPLELFLISRIIILTMRIKIVKAKTGQRSQVTVTQQTRLTFVLGCRLYTLAGYDLTEIRFT